MYVCMCVYVCVCVCHARFKQVCCEMTQGRVDVVTEKIIEKNQSAIEKII
jgi:hypothetical protein